MNIRELLIRIGVTGSDEATRKVTTLDNKVDDLKGSFNNLGAAITAAFGVFSLAAIAKSADEMQSLEARIGMLPQTIGSVADAFDKVAEKATENRMSVKAYAEVYTRIGNAAQDYVKTSEDLEKVTTTLSQALVVGGASAQEQSSAFLQFSQALGSGVLQGDEFRAMAEAAPQFLDQLAKALGKPRGELKKLASQGKLTTKEIISATMQMSDYFSQMFKKMPITISQAVVIVTNRFDLMVNRFNRASGAVTYVANAIVNAMSYIDNSVNYLSDAMGGAENAVKILGVALGAAGLIGALKAAQLALSAFFSPIGLVIAGLTALFLIGQDVYTWLQGGPSLLGDMIGPVSKFSGELDNLIQSLTDLKNMAVAVLDALNGLANFFNSSQDWTADLGKKLGTDQFAGWLKDAGGWLVKDLGKWKDQGNKATYGIFDVPQMWGDSMRGVAEHNQKNVEGYQRDKSYLDANSGPAREDDLSLGGGYRPEISPAMSVRQNLNDSGMNIAAPTVAGGTVNNVTVHIGTIDASNSDTPADTIRQAASEGVNSVLNSPAGYNRTLGDSLNFAGGGS